ncbi:YaaL family protein [Lachnospiraceae bacterium OttesenSCG-928-D06]|nr:YaaL family protein [Lachnospiraceae bacterium OttesenSCG-928-D06]
MKFFFHQKFDTPESVEEDFSIPTLQEDIVKTRQALEIAYAGFDNALDVNMIDCYIYEINSLLKRYKHLNNLAALPVTIVGEELYEEASVPPLVSHVLS